jgi:hypothetical protein
VVAAELDVATEVAEPKKFDVSADLVDKLDKVRGSSGLKFTG